MNYISRGLRYVAGGDASAIDQVPLLIERIKTSALPQDRRSAISHLTQCAKESPARQAQVGELALKIIHAVLDQDKEYDETLKAALDLLIAICGALDPPVEDSQATDGIADVEAASRRVKEFEDSSARAAATNVDVFLGLPNAASLLLELLENDDFYVKFGTIELLTAMAANSRQTLQMAILEAPQGVTRICDLLDDNHRHARSNAVLLLSTLCDESSEICKIVAYGGVLEKLFALIEAVNISSPTVAQYGEDDDEEENLESAIVVQDVLLVLRNLIEGTMTTKTFLRDAGCLPRLVNVLTKSAADANILRQSNDSPSQAAPSTGVKAAVEKQAKKNLIVVMNCVSALVKQNDSESKLIKNDLATTNLFQVLVRMSFDGGEESSSDNKRSRDLLPVRIAALKTVATLVRGHDEFRKVFSSSTYTFRNGEVATAQIANLRAMGGEFSSAIRAAAYSAMRESFVVDSGLDLPSSTLLNAMTGSMGPGSYPMSRGRTGDLPSGNDMSSPSTSILHIAESLKATLVGWPGSADAAGVFYAASLVSWVVERVEGAKERLLASYVSGGSLLPQIMRVVGKLEREKGPPEVRIALFSLACVWLYESPSAVSAFLSSAVHLPMLVEILNKSGSRGDLAEVHIRGLAAVVLGICLQVNDGEADPATDGGFLSGGGGASVVIPRGTIADVIRNRIGVTSFTECLDDIRATKAFSDEGISKDLWKLAENLAVMEERSGFMSTSGSLGHEHWYDVDLMNVVNNVYKNVGAKALDLIAESSQVSAKGAGEVNGRVSTMNGHAMPQNDLSVAQKAVLADSARDEVLNSYKEFIRTQDENLNAARRQIEELATALKETQLELDARSGTISSTADSNELSKLVDANAELMSQKQAMETLLDEKTADFAALSEAYASLEEDHANRGNSESQDANETYLAELQKLRSQNSMVRDSLNAEMSKNAELMHRLNLLDGNLKVRAVELESTTRERDMLRSNMQPSVVEALQWRTRAEVAESQIQSRQSMLDSMLNEKTAVERRLHEAELYRDETNASMQSLKHSFEKTQLELDELRSTRKRELQVARESSATSSAVSQQEIEALRHQLSEALQNQRSRASDASEKERQDATAAFSSLQEEYQRVVSSLEQVKTELLDSKSAMLQWQKRSEANEAAKDREVLENNRLAVVTREVEGELASLRTSFHAQTESFSAANARVTELDRQCVELDEMRQRAEEEAKTLREELAARTEQSIRLSGQLYETEEAKMRAEEAREAVERSLSSALEEVGMQKGGATDSAPSRQDGPSVEELELKIAAIKEELEVTKDSLADSKDRESLSEARARDRDAAVGKADTLEKEYNTLRAQESALQSEVGQLKERLLSLAEAEEAKHSLTMQVVSLQKSLSEASGNRSGVSANLLSEGQGTREALAEKRISQLQVQVDEKHLRLKELESSLTDALDRAAAASHQTTDLQKQVSETEALLSVVRSEKDEMGIRCAKLESELHERSQIVDQEAPSFAIIERKLDESEQKLADSETKRAALSQELATLVGACTQAEKEATRVQEENSSLRQQHLQLEAEVRSLQAEVEAFSTRLEVERFVDHVVVDASVASSSAFEADRVDGLRRERDCAVTQYAKATQELDSVVAKIAAQKDAIEEAKRATSEMAAEHSAEISSLQTELTSLRKVIVERDELSVALDKAQASVLVLESEKSAMLEAQKKLASRVKIAEEAAAGLAAKELSRPPQSPTRVLELEGALRDAAKTVSATHLELISAQALLVELSSDKTAMRTELASAQDRILALEAKISAQAAAPRAVGDHALETSRDTTDGVHKSVHTQELAEEMLKIANAEIENLRTMLNRSVAEAGKASSLLVRMEGTVERIEQRKRSSESARLAIEASKQSLEEEFAAFRSTCEEERGLLLKELQTLKEAGDKVRDELLERVRLLEEDLTEARASSSIEAKRFKEEVAEIQRSSATLEADCSNVKNKLKESTAQLEAANTLGDELVESQAELSANVRRLEGVVAKLKEELNASEQGEANLKRSLEEARETLTSTKLAFASERLELEEKENMRVRELEDEIERTSDNLEHTERKFRNAETALKLQISALEEEKKALSSRIASSKQELESTTSTLEDLRNEKDVLETRLLGTVADTRKEISVLQEQLVDTEGQLQTRTNEREALERKNVEVRRALRRAELDVKEELSAKEMLESENQDFLSSIESLEASSKKVQEDLQRTKGELNASVAECSSLKTRTGENNSRIEKMELQLRSNESEIKSLQVRKAELETTEDELRVSLDTTISTRDAFEQDNSDLRAWVADLERQATELQSAATNFEEVEQRLREALEMQRDASEHTTELVEELRREKEALSEAESLARASGRDKAAAECARDASQKRTADLEARVREIRQEHVEKMRRSEAAMLSKSQRCSELEALLAVAERNLAEQASMSDKLFGLQAELAEREADVGSMRTRAETAEGRVEELQRTVEGLKSECERIRESGSGEAFRALEAEHNELLICLADVELECTSLKEELGRE